LKISWEPLQSLDGNSLGLYLSHMKNPRSHPDLKRRPVSRLTVCCPSGASET
jgi:hypothetical protein